MRCIRGILSCLVLTGMSPLVAHAQNAVTIRGHVSANANPVRGAEVRIPAVDLATTTDADGRFSFIVPSSRVRGQTVTITARYLRYRPQSAELTLAGGAIIQDFDLTSSDTPTTPVRAADAGQPSVPVPTTSVPRVAVSAATSWADRVAVGQIVDSMSFTDQAGDATLASALAGRFAGLEVRTSTALGGSSSMLVRGSRSISGITQPLLVVNGIVFDDLNLARVSQRGGLGGFDYGSALNDLNVEDIAAVQLLSGAAASMQFGGRAANGVLLVTTKRGRGLNGIEVSGSQQYSAESALRLPSLQNRYGQGRQGQFSFFDGRGGGTNDSVSQSWGPALDGQPVTQASLTEAGRADVRAWLPRPTNFSDYLSGGRALATNLAVQSGSERGDVRVSVSNRSATGLTPASSVTRRSALITAGLRATSRLSLGGDLHLYSTRGEDRPGTGMDESNPVSVLYVTGRQVQIDTLKTRIRDAALRPISWHYSGHNNPWFATEENDNHDDHSRWAASGSATLDLASWLSAVARGGTDRSTDGRRLSVAAGWMGGYPYYAGRGDFSTGGYESGEISRTLTNGDVVFRARPSSSAAARLELSAGVGRRSDQLSYLVRGSDKLIDTTTTAPAEWSGSAATTSVFGGADALLRDFVSLSATARRESSGFSPGPSVATLYPSVNAGVDFARMDSSRRIGPFESLTLRAGWSRTGNDMTAAVAERLGTVPSATTLIASPELTSGWEVGTGARFRGGRLGVDVTMYNSRSENLRFASATGFETTGALSNKGIDATLTLVPLRTEQGLVWDIGLTLGKNSNVVDSLSGATSSVVLAPSYGGVTLEARPGSALGAIVGLGYLRDGSGQLLLRNGRPMADSLAGRRVLAESEPQWTGGLASSVRRGALSLSVLLDARKGGSVFSASNRAGAVAGVLAETAFRPDTGLLIAGKDATTGTPNTTHITTEEYYRALGDIAERWIYDASFIKLREVRASYALPLPRIRALRAQSLRASVIARNVALWTDVPNVDPEGVWSASALHGAEMGQLPSVRSIGFQLTLTP